ncbi:MAG: methyl-accepting chemotaxis protein [Alphaproteobacteria bacterium]
MTHQNVIRKIQNAFDWVIDKGLLSRSLGLSKLSIQAKLLATYTIVGVLTLVACLVSFNSFRLIEKTFSNVVEHDIGGMTKAFEMALDANQISINMRMLATAKDETSRAELRGKVTRSVQKLSKDIKLVSAETGNQDAEKISSLVSKLSGQIKTLDDLVSETLSRQKLLSETVQKSRTTHTEILKSSEYFSRIANDALFAAMEELFAGSEDANAANNNPDTAAAGADAASASEARSADDRALLLQEQISTLQGISDVVSNTNLAVGLLAEGAGLSNPDAINDVNKRFIIAIGAVGSGMVAMGEIAAKQSPEWVAKRDALTNAIDILTRLGDAENDLFDQSMKVLDAANRTHISLNEVQNNAEQLTAIANRQVAEGRTDVQTGVASVSGRISGSEFTLLILSIISVAAVAFIAFYYVGHSVTRPLRAMGSSMRTLAAGDLTVEIPFQDRHDEIGDMSSAVQVFKENAIEVGRAKVERDETRLRAAEEKRQAMEALAASFEDTVGLIVKSVSTGSLTMKQTAEQMSGIAALARDRSDQVSTAASSASGNVETVAAASEELNYSINEIEKQMTHSNEVALSAVERAEATNQTMIVLSETAVKIGKVVDLINHIARQTNLLALNATSEAARAGQAGKGFAVVASEVKNLAKQTAEATMEISDQIEEMQNVSSKALEAIATIRETISEMSNSVTSVASAVRQQSSATQEISQNTQQAASSTRDVSANIAAVQAANDETSEAAIAVVSAAGSLSTEADKLRTEVHRFLVQVRAS